MLSKIHNRKYIFKCQIFLILNISRKNWIHTNNVNENESVSISMIILVVDCWFLYIYAKFKLNSDNIQKNIEYSE